MRLELSASRRVGATSGTRCDREAEAEAEPDFPMPAKDLSGAVELVIADQSGDEKTAFEIVDRFSGAMIHDLCRLVTLFAVERAADMTKSFKELFEGEPEFDLVTADPITSEDILTRIPTWLA